MRMNCIAIAFIFLNFCALMHCSHLSDSIIIHTNNGPIRGISTQLGNRFLSVPYASPPVENLRFSPPQPIKNWSQIINTTNDPPGCPQVCTLPSYACPTSISEDCLYLNIFTPPIATAARATDESQLQTFAVMLFIHGGSFVTGYSGGWLYNGTQLAYQNNVIVVTVNYRLGVLGSLYDPQIDITGNFNYLDQKMAIKWVYNNIKHFGGDSSRITIFGQSAGASSVSLHLIDQNNYNNGNFYFKRAIMESNPLGTKLNDPITWRHYTSVFYYFLGCNHDHDHIYDDDELELKLELELDLRQCLMNASMDEIIIGQEEAVFYLSDFSTLKDKMYWTPTIDGELFIQQPLFAFQNNNYINDKYSIDIMFGINENEMWLFTNPNLTKVEYFAQINELFYQSNNSNIIINEVEEEYPVNLNTNQTYCNNMALITTDMSFKCPNHNISFIMSQNSNAYDTNNFSVYFYHFNEIAQFNKYILNPGGFLCYTRCCHESELPFVFQVDFSLLEFKYDRNHQANWTQSELKLSQGMQKFWTNFAKTGNPATVDNVSWIKYDPIDRQTMVFSSDRAEIKSNYDDYKCEFWNSLNYDWI